MIDWIDRHRGITVLVITAIVGGSSGVYAFAYAPWVHWFHYTGVVTSATPEFHWVQILPITSCNKDSCITTYSYIPHCNQEITAETWINGLTKTASGDYGCGFRENMAVCFSYRNDIDHLWTIDTGRCSVPNGS